MKQTIKIKKNIREEVGAVQVLHLVEKMVDCMEYCDTVWTESNDTGEIINTAQIKICRDVLRWIAESDEFNFYENFM